MFEPDSILVEKKSDKMTALYAMVGDEKVFVGSSLGSKDYTAEEKAEWMAAAMEAHYGIKVTRPGKAKKAPAKKAAAKAAPAKGKGLKKIGKK